MMHAGFGGESVPELEPPRHLLSRRAAVVAGLLLAGVAVRVVALKIARDATSLDFDHLALYADGHEYITIAQSFPLPYGPDLWVETAWLPGYPLAIAIAFQVVGNYAVAALLVSVLACASAAPLLFALARGRPGALSAAMLLTVGPPVWLLASILPHSESVFLPLFLATVLLGRRGHFSVALVTGVLAAATRHAGLVLTPILLVQRWRQGERRPFALGACALPALVIPLLNLYLRWRIPGYPGLQAVNALFWGGSHFDIPLRAFLFGLASVWVDPWVTTLNVTSLVVAAIGLVDALRQHEFDLAVWAGAFLVLTVSLHGPQAFWDIDRFLLPALPVALLALARLRLPRPAVAAAVAGLLVLSLACVPTVRRAVYRQNLTLELAQHIDRVADCLHGGGPFGILPATAMEAAISGSNSRESPPPSP